MEFHSYNIGTININNITNDTKLNALRHFVRSQDLDIVFLQEIENETLSIPGYNSVCNVDHTRRGTAILLKNYIRYTHVEKSLDSRLISLRINDTITLCNIYAQSGSQHRASREAFFNNTVAYYLRNQGEYTIMSGDFNAVTHPKDSTGVSNNSMALKNTIQQLRLADVWEVLHGNRVEHTYICHNSASRIDRIYTSSNLRPHIRTAITHACSFTDHLAVTARLCLPTMGREHGRGFWSLRPNVLTNDTLEEFEVKWSYWTRQRRNYTSWLDWWISFVKPRLQSFFRKKSREMSAEFYNQHQHLYSQLRAAYNNYHGNPATLAEINKIKAKMLILQRKNTQMFQRINESCLAGEPLSVFQLGDRIRKRTIIREIEESNGNVIEDPAAVQEHIVNYFKDLYAETNMVREHEPFLCERRIPPDSLKNNTSMDPITTNEIFSAIKGSAARKSPGPDGIPREFYLWAFDVIHRELNLMLNEGLRGNISPEFVNGVIVLVHKKNAGNTIKSYRPISLLNYDYKLLARILKSRLDCIMTEHNIISNVQKCSNGKRTIFGATLAIKDKIAQLRKHRRAGKLLSFDLDHAFDRVNRRFLFDTMDSLGFNTDLVHLLSAIAEHSTSRLLLNGHLSAPFPIQRSVRQGDPLSMHLFVIYFHPLLQRIQEVCSGQFDLVVAYADDVTMISTCREKIERVKQLFLDFERCAGALLNLGKTAAMDVGYTTPHNKVDVGWAQTYDSVKILGVLFTNSIRRMIMLNWNTLIAKMAQQIWLHKMRVLTLHQKVLLMNTFISSKMWYIASILPMYKLHIAKVTSLIGSFLWQGQVTRIAIHQLALPLDKGGLNLHLPIFKCSSLLINRHLCEIDSLPFYRSFMDAIQNPPNLSTIPTDCPCLKLICQELAYIPPNVLETATSATLHRRLVSRIEHPKVMQESPNYNWRQIWLNVNSRQLSSSERSTFYILVNRKAVHAKLLHRMNLLQSSTCEHCGVAEEDLQHKYSSCARTTNAWAVYQQTVNSFVPNRNFSFEDMMTPTLQRLGRTIKIKIMKLFICYVNFINSSENVIQLDSLKFHLEIICNE